MAEATSKSKEPMEELQPVLVDAIEELLKYASKHKFLDQDTAAAHGFSPLRFLASQLMRNNPNHQQK